MLNQPWFQQFSLLSHDIEWLVMTRVQPPLILPCPHTFSPVHPYIYFNFFKFFMCLLVTFDGLGHFKWLELPPPASTLTFLHLQFCVFNIPLQAHHQEPERKASLHSAALSIEQSVAVFCSEKLKYFTWNQAKRCLHLPGAKWWGPHPDNTSMEALH